MKSYFASSVLLFSSALAAHANLVIGLPADSSNCFPFGCDYQAEYQQVYTHNVFPGSFEIIGLGFSNTASNSHSSSLNSGSVTIALSETSADWNTLVPLFSANIGVNNVQVFNGSIGGPWALGDTLTLMFSTPYIYDPAAGNLLIDVHTSLSGGQIADFDFNGPNTIMGQVSAFGGQSFGSPLVENGFGLVTDFLGSRVPEPSTLLLVGTTLGVVAFLSRWRKKSRSN